MADLKTVLAKATELNRNIEQFLKFSTYDRYTDLSGLEIDFTNGEQIFLWDELRVIADRLADVQEMIVILSRLLYTFSTRIFKRLDSAHPDNAVS